MTNNTHRTALLNTLRDVLASEAFAKLMNEQLRKHDADHAHFVDVAGYPPGALRLVRRGRMFGHAGEDEILVDLNPVEALKRFIAQTEFTEEEIAYVAKRCDIGRAVALQQLQRVAAMNEEMCPVCTGACEGHPDHHGGCPRRPHEYDEEREAREEAYERNSLSETGSKWRR